MTGHLVNGGTNLKSRKICLPCRCSALFSLFPFPCAQGLSPFYLIHPERKIKVSAGGLSREEKKHDNGEQAEGKEAKNFYFCPEELLS